MDNIDGLDDLAYYLTGCNENDHPDIHEVLMDCYRLSYRDYRHIIEELLKLTPILESPLTGNRYHAFMKDGFAIAKMKIK